MLILGIDTAGRRGGVALVEDGALVAGGDLGPAGNQAERLPATIDAVLEQAGRSPAEVGLVAANVGPGSFTGMRIGIAAAQGFAWGAGCPAVGVPALLILAAWADQVTEGHGVLYLPVIDARRGEVYTAAFRGAGAGFEEVLSARVLAAAGIRALIDALPAAGPGEGPLVLTGDGVPPVAAVVAALARPVLSVMAPMPPDGAAVTARMGGRIFAATRGAAPLGPIYLRPPDARRPAGKTRT